MDRGPSMVGPCGERTRAGTICRRRRVACLLAVFLASGHSASAERGRGRLPEVPAAARGGGRLRRPSRPLRQRELSSVDACIAPRSPRGGGEQGDSWKQPQPQPRRQAPSMYWALLHNWLYFLSLGFNLINVPFLVRGIVDGEETISGAHVTRPKPSREAISLSGKVESVDRFMTFLGVGFLSALSDRYGRRPLMAWSALGFMLTNLIQARCTAKSVATLYVADFVDGCSSCMLPLCQAYVADVSPPSKRAANLGVFQGLSAGCAFIIAFPVGGLLGARLGPRVPLLAAAALQLLNALIILLVTPESNPVANDDSARIDLDLREVNPVGGLVHLFGRPGLLRAASATYLLSALARTSLDAQFTNYSNLRFGWTQAQSGPVLVLVGLMLAIVPRLVVPTAGMRNAILWGLAVLAAGLIGTGLAPTPAGFVSSIFVVALGTVCLPALQALLANLADPGQRGALLGAVGSINELTGAVGSTLYAAVLALFTSDGAPLPLPGMHFLVGAGFVVVAVGIAWRGLNADRDHPALNAKDGVDVMQEPVGI